MENNNQLLTWEMYMYFLRSSLEKKKIDDEHVQRYKDVEFVDIVKNASDNGQFLLMKEAFADYAKMSGINYSENAKNGLVTIIAIYEKYKIIRKLIEESKKEGLTFVIFKGPVLANLYPDYTKRTSCDTDIFVYKEEKDAALKLITGLGYVIDEKHTNPEVTVFDIEPGMYKGQEQINASHTIELHTCLWEDYKGRRLDVLKSLNLTEKSSLININACGFEVTTLGYTNHLIFQFFHIIKHFSLEGVGPKYLVDICLYVNTYIDEIDLEYFWSAVEKLSYKKFVYSVFAICARFLGMNTRIMQGQEIESGDEINDFMVDILTNGNVYGNKEASWQILGMMTPYFTGEQKVSDSSYARKLAVIFPKSKDLPDDYAYARKIKILLPIAWLHKAVKYLINYRKHKSSWYNATEKLDAADHRLKMMKDMDLLN